MGHLNKSHKKASIGIPILACFITQLFIQGFAYYGATTGHAIAAFTLIGALFNPLQKSAPSAA